MGEWVDSWVNVGFRDELGWVEDFECRAFSGFVLIDRYMQMRGCRFKNHCELKQRLHFDLFFL